MIFESQLKDIRIIKKATRDIIKKGEKMALEEYHDAKSLEKLKKEIINNHT